MISPASRNSSAHATAQTSARDHGNHLAPPRELAHRGLVVGLAAGQVGGDELLPRLVGARRFGVVALELLVAPVVRFGGGEVGAVGCLDDGVDHHPVDQQRLRRNRFHQLLGRHHPFDREEALLRGHQVQVVEVRVDARVGRVALLVAEIHVHERRVEVQRGHRDEFLVATVGGVRGLHGLELVTPERAHIAAQARADRQERKSLRRSLQAASQHAFVHLAGLDRAAGARLGEPRVVERRRVQRHEAVVDPLDLACRAQQPDVGPAVGHDGEVGDVGAQQGPHERHRLAPRPPAADADGHAALDRGDGLVESRPLVAHALVLLVRSRRTRRGARRTPRTG